MSDPKPTIKVASCREDGRCPECGGDVGPPRGYDMRDCGCRTHLTCREPHLRALLTEALRQLSEARFRLGKAAIELPEIAGPVHHRIQKFREMFSAQITKERERAEKAEALLRDIAHRFGAVQVGVETMAKIREVISLQAADAEPRG